MENTGTSHDRPCTVEIKVIIHSYCKHMNKRCHSPWLSFNSIFTRNGIDMSNGAKINMQIYFVLGHVSFQF